MSLWKRKKRSDVHQDWYAAGFRFLSKDDLWYVLQNLLIRDLSQGSRESLLAFLSLSKRILHNTPIGYGHTAINSRLHLLQSLIFIIWYLKSENLALMIQAGFKLKNEEFRPEYEDLENRRTEKLIDKIEGAVGISLQTDS